VIRNVTSSPNRREDFTVGIGYNDRIPYAQEVALAVLADHPAVLKDPEPWVLVDALSTSTVTLRVYFWLDGSRHSWLKVRSSVIRLVKRALQDAEISLPDEAREVIFPEGVPVRMLAGQAPGAAARGDGRAAAAAPREGAPAEEVSTRAEANLHSDAEKIEKQARQAWSPDQGENLLRRG
jgi:small-conductance mechanosensitive channel